jgi:N-acetyl-anhydromuramyl-L-alanine amidase AmpD
MGLKIIDVSTKKPYCSSNRGGAKPKFLVLHYSGTPGASGKSLAIRFARPYVEENDRLSSAHYVVDGGKVYLAVPVAR